MTRAVSILAALALAPLALAPVAATAQDSSPGATADITGAWSFETEVYESRCRMTGELDVRESGQPGVYRAQLVAYESCTGQEPYHAEQVSAIRREGDQVKIESRLVRVEPSPEFYLPDDFVLTIIDSALMVGELRSADIAPVTFRRRTALIG